MEGKLINNTVLFSWLFQQSDNFKIFYQKEFPKINFPIKWIHNPNLPKGIDYRNTLEGGVQYMILRRAAPSLSDIPMIAHEVMHTILRIEGFGSVGSSPKFENLSSSLNSMLQDPIIDSRLKNEYSFDLVENYLKELREGKRLLKHERKIPEEHYRKIQWIFNFTAKRLDSEVMVEINDEFKKFLVWSWKRFNKLKKDSDKLYNLVKERGFDTPEKQNALIYEIINMFNLSNVIVFKP